MVWRCIGDRWVDGLGGLEGLDGLGGLEGWRDEWGAGWARGLALEGLEGWRDEKALGWKGRMVGRIDGVC